VLCVDVLRRAVWRAWLMALLLGVMPGCTLFSKDESKPVSKSGATPTVPTPAPAPTVLQTSRGPIKLPQPGTPRSWVDARLQAAKRMMMANPDGTYASTPPDILLAIPVMSIELNADGSIRKISVMRYPSQARDTVDMAMAAIRRAAPFGDVSKLPKPWKFNETFLFNADRKFKPMTLDQR
jgi:hypothetical protein